MTTETITWHPLATEGPPDADITVLVSVEDASEPTWLGFFDGDVWRDAATGGKFASSVTAWADMPEGYRP